jgi:hypothetical protein
MTVLSKRHGPSAVTSHRAIALPSDDWRRQGQEKYLYEAILFHRPYRQNPYNPGWDHDHCEFCGANFFLDLSDPTILKAGYTTEDDYNWICPVCYEDFRAEFKWTVKEDMT